MCNEVDYIWKQPRRVDQWWWMDVEIIDNNNGDMVRYGRVSWNQDGTDHYDVSLSCEREGYGFYCWPSFRNLSDAQNFIEQLMPLSLQAIEARHGTQWQGIL